MSAESPLRRLSTESRRALIDAIRSKRVAPPYAVWSLRPILGAQASEEISTELARLEALGLTPGLLEELLVMTAPDRAATSASLVWTGPEDTSAATRDTGVVVRELFQRATSHVLVAGFAIHQGASVFRVLAERMDAIESLEVDMYLNVERGYGDTTAAEELLRVFADRFRDEHWSGRRRPNVFYDPRALEPSEKGKKRAAMHAKCVVVDRRHALVGSANFTEAAQERNIEAGVLVDDPSFAGALIAQFAWLSRSAHMRRVPGL